MRISDEQIKKILEERGILGELAEIDEDAAQRDADRPLIKQVTREVINMPDREALIAELKAKIEAGEYNPTGDDIADAMIRRNIADHCQ